ncbi:hypothetical protein V6B16_11485 [Salinimicrobium catena]|uniref:hypothetical protein n=1 Tax=Salinimicrobium catena TaxID=390640 RepID=UPI002FE4808C
MNPLAKQKRDFKPELIFTDKRWIHSKISEGKLIEEKLNKAAAEVKKIFNSPLSDEELKKVMSGKYAGVVSLLKEKAGFPQAEDETFFKIAGIKPEKRKSIIEAFNKLVGISYRMDEFEIKNGRFFLSQDSIESYEKIATYYTKSEKGNIALKIAKNICKELNEALENGLIIYPSQGERTAPSKALNNLINEKVVEVKKTGPVSEKIIVEYYPNYDKIRFI